MINAEMIAKLINVPQVIGAIVVVIILNLFALCLYKRYQRKKVNEQISLQVNSAISQYFKLSGQEPHF